MNILRVFTPTSRLAVWMLLLAALLLSACGGGPGDSWAGVSINPDDDTIYVTYDERLVALDPASGGRLWEYPPKDSRDAKIYAVPVINNGTIYVGDYKGRLHAVSTDGELQWVYEPDKDTLIGPISTTADDRVIGPAAVDSDKVFFGLGSRNVIAVSRETAKEVWVFETNHGVWAAPLYVPANPDDETSRAMLYVVSLDHFLYAINPETGAELWKKDLGGAAPGNMVYDQARSRIYVGTFLSELVAIDVQTREIVDRFKTKDWIWGSPAFQDDVLYFGDLSGELYAVRVSDNGFEQIWQRAVAENAIRATPLLTDGMVIVGSKDKKVYAVEKQDGSSRWYKSTKGEILTNLVFVPANAQNDESVDRVVIGTDDKDRLIVAFNAATGDEDWHYSD